MMIWPVTFTRLKNCTSYRAARAPNMFRSPLMAVTDMNPSVWVRLPLF